MAKILGSSGAMEKIGVGAMFNLGLNGMFAVSDYKTAREEGSSRVGSVAKAAGNFALYEAMGWWTLPFQAASALPSAAVSGYEAVGKLTRQMNQQGKQVPFVNSNFQDYNQAFTMRQAGMQMAQASKYNLQQTLLGNEAAYLNK